MMYLAATRRAPLAMVADRPAARKPKAASARARLARRGAVRRDLPLRATKRRRRAPVPEAALCRPWQSWWEHTTYQA